MANQRGFNQGRTASHMYQIIMMELLFTVLASISLTGCSRDSVLPLFLGAAKAGFERILECCRTPVQEPPNVPVSGEGKTVLVPTVEGLDRGSSSFSIVVENRTADLTFTLPLLEELIMLDEHGAVYDVDPFATGLRHLTRTIPPRSKVRLRFVLESPIAMNATIVTFVLKDITFITDGYAKSSPFPPLRWHAYPPQPQSVPEGLREKRERLQKLQAQLDALKNKGQ